MDGYTNGLWDTTADKLAGRLYSDAEREARRMHYPRPRKRAMSQPGALEWVSVSSAALLLGVSEQRIRKLLHDGRIEGARRGKGKNRPWTIPLSGGKPVVSPGTRGPDSPYARRIPI